MSDNKPTAKVVHFTDVPAEGFGDEAPGVSIRLLIDAEHDGAPVYVLRMIEVATGCRTPDHNHPFEHENFVVEGLGEVVIEGAGHQVAQGDVIFVPPGVQHTYRNTGEGTFSFLCGIPVSRAC
jgi:quercetin dioxygenase-like cupin family protein